MQPYRGKCRRICVQEREVFERLKQSTDPKDKITLKLMKCHEKSTGGFISGEVKLAITLRILAGGSYLDLALLYDTSSSYAYEIFHSVIKNWILDDKLVKISGADYMNNEKRLEEVALGFMRKSNGVVAGCIGAIDGWLVKIIRPSYKDGVKYPGTFILQPEGILCIERSCNCRQG